MLQLTIVQDYILNAILKHRVVKPMGNGDTVWAGVDFSRDIGVFTEEHDMVRDLYDAIEDWLLITLREGDRVPVIDGIDLNSEDGKRLVAWHTARQGATDPDQDWFWTDEWQAGEREASRQIEAGEGTVYETGEEFLAALDEDCTRC